MKNIKACVFDLDNTIVCHKESDIRDNLKEIFKVLQDKGIYVVYNTSRNIDELKKFVSDFDNSFDYCLSSAGSQIIKDHQVIKCYTMSYDDVKPVLDKLKDKDVNVIYSLKDNLLYFDRHATDTKRAEFAMCYSKIPQVREMQPGDEYIDIAITGYEDIVKETVENCCPNIEVFLMNGYVSFLSPKGQNKAGGCLFLCDHLGISTDNLLVFGDGDNDIDMFKLCKNSVALENASDNLKQYAKYVCGKDTEDGVYHFLKGLIESEIL